MNIVGSNVISVLDTLKSYSSKISAEMDNLGNQWVGVSHDSIYSKVENMLSEYNSTISSQMEAFANACDLYNEYLKNKNLLANAEKNMAIATENLNRANSAHNTSVAQSAANTYRQYSEAASNYRSQISSLRQQISSLLSNASSPVLDATSVSPHYYNGQGIVSGTASGTVISNVLNWAVGIANDNSHGYSNTTRWGNPNFDCSSFVISAWESAGVPVKEAGASYTGDMKNAFLSTGKFTWIPGNPNINSLQPGDVLLNEGKHTELYVGDGKLAGAKNNHDGVDGDSMGTEIVVAPPTANYTWQGVLRYIG